MGSLLLPGTDRAVVVEALVVFPCLIVALVRTRRDRELRIFVLGVFLVTLGFFGLRALH